MYYLEWLCVNKLSLNIDKSNFVLFHPAQKKVTHTVKLTINNKLLVEKKFVKYLGIIIDSRLNWKKHVSELSKKIARGIGLITKLRHFVNVETLIQVYYSIIFPFLTYGVLIWGNTYKTNIEPLTILQKKALRIITFSNFSAHTSPIFKLYNLLKFSDIVKFYTAIFMHQFSSGKLPTNFDDFFSLINTKHKYNTRLASKSSYSLPRTRTNYGIFNIRYSGPKIWNSIDESIKSLSIYPFKRQLKNYFISVY